MECTTAKVKVQNELSESFRIRNELRQGDALACILFNTALEKIIRDANINQQGNIFYKSVQILAYADVHARENFVLPLLLVIEFR